MPFLTHLLLGTSRGLLKGNLNVYSSDHVHYILSDSNVDFLALSETLLHSNMPSVAIDVQGIEVFGQDQSKGNGNLFKGVKSPEQIRQSSGNDLACIVLTVLSILSTFP